MIAIETRRGAPAQAGWLSRLGPVWRGVVAPAVGPVIVALVGVAAVLAVMLSRHEYNPTGLIHIGDWLRAERFWTERTILERGDAGYDGQYFFYLAHDPWLRAGDLDSFLDHPAYRAGRVLYPALVWAASLGRPETIPWAMVGVNLVAVALGTAAMVDVLRSLGGSRWLAVAYAFNPAILFGVTSGLSEPSTYALIALGLALGLRCLHGRAGLVLALAALGREVSAVVPLVFAVRAARRADGRAALAYLTPLAIPAAWHLWVWQRIGRWPALDGPPNFALPLVGPIGRVSVLLGWRDLQPGEPPLSYQPGEFWNTMELLVIGILVTLIVLGLARALRGRDVIAQQLGAQCALALFTSPAVWVGMGSYTRVLGLLILFYGLALVRQRGAAR